MIHNRFKHCFKQSSSTGTDKEQKINDGDMQSMEPDASKHGVRFTCTGLSSLLNQQEEKYVVQVTTPDELVPDVASLPEPTAPDSDEEKGGDLHEVFSVKKQLIALATAQSALKWHVSMISEVLKAFRQCQRTLRLEEQRLVTQKTISNFSS